MKKILLAVTALFMINAMFAQDMVKTTSLSNIPMVKKTITGREEAAPQNIINPITRAVSRNFVGTTYYDLQTNGSMSNKVVAHSDGTISTVWTTGSSAASRGTGYNYFNGTSWVNSSTSTDRIENTRTGWSTITSVGDAEIVAAHNGTDALVISICPQKGTNNWIYSTLEGPVVSNGSNTSTCLLWPALASNGNTIHLIACTESDAGYLYNGIQTCLVYYRGTFNPSNNTISWEAPRIVGDVTASEVSSFSGDAYSITAKGNNVAVFVANNASDAFLWKSTDNGVNFTKTMVFQHPYPGYNESTTLVVDTPYVPDGSCAVALDANGNAHVAFGITRLMNDDLTDGTYSWFPGVVGMLYWNETQQPILNTGKYSLDPDTLAAAGYTVIKRSDLNRDGGAYFGGESYDLPSYGVTCVSMPQILIDGNNVYLVFAELLDWPFLDFTNSKYFRGIFGLKSTNNGASFGDASWLSYNKDCYYVDSWDWVEDTTMTISQLLENYIYMSGESVFPAVAPELVNGKIVMTWQQDYIAGSSIKEDNVSMASSESFIYYLKMDADSIGLYNNVDEVSQGLWIDPTGINNHNISGMKMYPNPASESVNVTFSAENAENGVVSVMNLMGQTVYTSNVEVNEGYNMINIPVKQFSEGVYMVTLRTNTGISTQKLIVK